MPPAERSGFPAFVAELIDHRRILKQDFARELGVKPPVLSQILSGCYQEPSLDLCIRLAQVGRVPLERVLRAAGRTETAKQLAVLQAQDIRDVLSLTSQQWPDEPPITDRERRVLTLWRSLDAPQAEALETFLERIAPAPPTPRVAPQRRRRRA